MEPIRQQYVVRKQTRSASVGAKKTSVASGWDQIDGSDSIITRFGDVEVLASCGEAKTQKKNEIGPRRDEQNSADDLHR